MHGLHLTADLRDCPLERAAMTDPDALRTLCVDAVRAVGLRPVGELFHRFAALPGAPADARGEPLVGITGVVLLAESHLAVHTWPEIAAVTLDVYVCNLGGTDNSARAHRLLETLIDAFAPRQVERHALTRGEGVPAERRAAVGHEGAPRGPWDRPTYSSGEGPS